VLGSLKAVLCNVYYILIVVVLRCCRRRRCRRMAVVMTVLFPMDAEKIES